MALVQLNARLDEATKTAGDETLRLLDWSITQAVRCFWEFLAAHRGDPSEVERLLGSANAADVASTARVAGVADEVAAERGRKLALAHEGSRLCRATCAALGLSPDASLWDRMGSGDELLEEALEERARERGLA